jgi:hypothetical protein
MTPHTQTIVVGDPSGLPGDCLRAAVASLLDLPTEAVPHFALFGRNWWNALALWCDGNGYLLNREQAEPSIPCLAFGMSPRDVYHAVVWADGECMHDPHPSRAGLSDAPGEFWAIERLA